MFVANVGDSMIVMGSRDIPEKPNQMNQFIAKDLTIDHKPELLKERKRIEKSGGWYMIFLSRWLRKIFLSSNFYRQCCGCPVAYFCVV